MNRTTRRPRTSARTAGPRILLKKKPESASSTAFGLAGLLLAALLSVCGVAAAGASSRPGQPQIRVQELERRIHVLVNHERVERTLTALEWDDRLAALARAQSSDMVRRHFFSHVNPDGQDPAERARRAGYACAVGENLYQGNLYSGVVTKGSEKAYDWNSADDIAGESVKGWMASAGHRQNILQGAYHRAGLGVAISADDKVYITQLFC